MHSGRRFALALALAGPVLSSGCASAQTTGTPPPRGSGMEGIEISGNTITSRRGPPLGFTYRGTPSVAPDGAVRSADYPLVVAVVEGSPAQRSGIAVGDVIVRVNGRDGREAALFRDRSPGTRYVVRVRRGDREEEITFVFGPAGDGAAPKPR